MLWHIVCSKYILTEEETDSIDARMKVIVDPSQSVMGTRKNENCPRIAHLHLTEMCSDCEVILIG
jgi:hypothetical protein